MSVDDIKPMDAIHAIYLDWVNNYLTTSRMADHYGLREDTMGDLIERGRLVHESRVRYNRGWHDGMASQGLRNPIHNNWPEGGHWDPQYAKGYFAAYTGTD